MYTYTFACTSRDELYTFYDFPFLYVYFIEYIWEAELLVNCVVRLVVVTLQRLFMSQMSLSLFSLVLGYTLLDQTSPSYSPPCPFILVGGAGPNPGDKH